MITSIFTISIVMEQFKSPTVHMMGILLVMMMAMMIIITIILIMMMIMIMTK